MQRVVSARFVLVEKKSASKCIAFMLAHIKKMRKRIIIILTLLIVGTLTTIYYKPFSNSEIIILEHMTENQDGKLDQICLVLNPPRSSEKLKKLIIDFNLSNKTANGLHNRLFIKEHDYELPIFPFPHNPDYKSEMTTRDELDNIDFLGDSYVSVDFDGDTIRRTKVYVGEIYYYKK